MNYKITLGLIGILALVIVIGVLVTTQGGRSTPERVGPPRQFFYQVDDDDINKVVVTHKGQTVQFVTDSTGTWRFNDANGEPVNLERWGGVTLLLSGPQYKRKLAAESTDLARYGLTQPSTIVTVGLKNQGDAQIKVGDQTPQGNSHYTQFRSLKESSQEDPGIYLVDASWGQVIARLVTEPPRLPTPTPASTEAPAQTPAAPPTPAR
jgi:hypothetical protein